MYYKLATLLLILSCLTACYRVPTDDDYSLLPLTNSPDLRGGNNGSAIPGLPGGTY